MSTSVGFHAVGMKPIRLRWTRSSTAIAFSPPSATYSRRPSGLTARPFGIAPVRAPRARPTAIVRMTRSRRVSMTETVSVLPLAV